MKSVGAYLRIVSRLESVYGIKEEDFDDIEKLTENLLLHLMNISALITIKELFENNNDQEALEDVIRHLTNGFDSLELKIEMIESIIEVPDELSDIIDSVSKLREKTLN